MNAQYTHTRAHSTALGPLDPTGSVIKTLFVVCVLTFFGAIQSRTNGARIRPTFPFRPFRSPDANDAPHLRKYMSKRVSVGWRVHLFCKMGLPSATTGCLRHILGMGADEHVLICAIRRLRAGGGHRRTVLEVLAHAERHRVYIGKVACVCVRERAFCGARHQQFTLNRI